MHLETRVFRQEIQEHLCALCAGIRADPDSGQRAAPAAFLDSVQMYLQQAGQIPRLTSEQEIAIWRRIEAAEHVVEQTLISSSAIGKHLILLGTELLIGKERFDHLVARRKIRSPDAYLAALPGVIGAAQVADRALTAAWNEVMKSDDEADREKRLHAYRERASSSCIHFMKFSFRLNIFEAYLERLRPTAEEIESLDRILARSTGPNAPQDASSATRAALRRLREIETEQRATAPRLVSVVAEAQVHARAAHQAKTEIVTAHLQAVISLAKEFMDRGPSFLDLIQAGNLGLMQAVERFAYRDDGEFVAFAAPLVRRELARAVADRPDQDS